MHLETSFWEQCCVQMTISIPGTMGKCKLEGEHPFLTEFVLIMDSCFIQYNAPLKEYINVAQKMNLFCQEWLVLCQFQIHFIILEVWTVSVTVHNNTQMVRISLEVYTYFSATIINCPFQAIYFYFLESVFLMSGISPTISVNFSGEVFGVVSAKW